MNAEILAVGNEVVDGSIVNTNAAYLAQGLSLRGIAVRFHSAVPDDEKPLTEALHAAQRRSQLVLVTGGLGPTVDDFTLEVAAKFFGKRLTRHDPSLARIREFFSRLGRPLTPNQEKQALVPEGATVLANPVGTAPGIYYLHQGVHWAFFPGVPREMQKMFAGEFLPILEREMEKTEFRVLKVLRCFGLTEGQMDDRLHADLRGRLNLKKATLGFRVRFPTIDIRLSAAGRNEKAAREELQTAEAVVRERLGDCLFGEEEDTLESVVGKMLRARGLKLATAESCTGGLLANQITDVPGASEYFLEGVVSYADAAKIDLLGVKKKTLETFGAVSRETALEMARGIVRRSGADCGVATTGIAGPTGGTAEKPVGTVHLAIVHPGGEWEQRYFFPFGRDRFKAVTVAAALDRLRRILSADVRED